MAETAAVATEEAAEEEALPAEEYAEDAEVIEEPAAAEEQGAGSQTYDYTAGGSSYSKTEAVAAVETPTFSGSTAADIPAEEAAPEATENTADESPAETAPAELKTTETANTAAAAIPLSKAKAQALLQSQLNDRGGTWTVTDSGQTPDGTAWLFTAEESADRLPHHFSVSAEDGQVTELSP